MNTKTLIPFWIGIVLNMICVCVNLSCIGHNGPITRAWLRYSPWALGATWVVLIAWFVVEAM